MRKELGSIEVYSRKLQTENMSSEDHAKRQKLQEVEGQIAKGGLAVREIASESTSSYMVARNVGTARFGRSVFEVDAVISGNTGIIVEENITGGAYRDEKKALNRAAKKLKVSEGPRKGFIESKLPGLYELATRDRK